MSNRYVYQLTETLILNSPKRETVERDLGVFRSLSVAENFLREYLKKRKSFLSTLLLRRQMFTYK